jgi:carbamate kinase
VRREERLEGAEAVIDKDRASAALARAVDADVLVMLTGVERVSLDYGTRWQRDMARLTVTDADGLLAAGEFPPGSMGPKVESAVRFVRGGGSSAVITCAEQLLDGVDGSGGTRIVRDAEGPSATAWTRPTTVAAA